MFILENVKKFAEEGRMAAVGAEGNITYSELDKRSEAMAAFLLNKYRDKSPVVLWGDKEHDMLTGVLAALKAGRPYIMVPNYLPEKRAGQITGSCKPCAVFNVSDKPFPVSGDFDCYNTDDIEKLINDNYDKTVSLENWLKPDETACIFYTSGSTGTPKGVVMTGKNLKAYVDWWYPLSYVGVEEPRMLNFAAYSFSASITTIYNGLGMLGATLYAIDKPLSMDYSRLIDFIVEANPHYFDCTPSFAGICMDDPRFCSDIMTNMRQFSVGGEPLPRAIAVKMHERFPNSQIINAYGATETTIGTILCEITTEMTEKDGPLPIGYASFNSRCEIWDENGNELPDGETGELVIISDMITNGYYNDPEKTEKVFFTASDGTRGYHTHDLAWKKDGLIYYVGRNDNLVKVGGYRVELEEVEQFLCAAAPVEKGYAVPVMKDINIKTLAAFVKLKPGFKPGLMTTAAIKKELRSALHPYMVPQKIIYVEDFPRNANDKVDRRAMIEMCRIK